jgi:thioredoxin 1
VLALAIACGPGSRQTRVSEPDDEIVTTRAAPDDETPSVGEDLDPSADVLEVNEPGQKVELEPILADGKVTVVEFYADWCAPCQEIERRVLAVMSSGSAVALRKVNIGEDAETPVARQHDVKTVPSVLIYDRQGELRYTLEGKKCQQAAEIAGQLAR